MSEFMSGHKIWPHTYALNTATSYGWTRNQNNQNANKNNMTTICVLGQDAKPEGTVFNEGIVKEGNFWD